MSVLFACVALFPLGSPADAPSDLFLLAHCPVSGEAFGNQGAKVVREYDGREIRLCCKQCIKEFEADKSSFLAAIDKEMATAQRSFYPLDTCAVSGEKLGSMGDPVEFVYQNRLVRLCCKQCTKGVEKDSAKIFAKLDRAAIEKQSPGYPLQVCVVDKKPLEKDKVVNLVTGNRLVRFCSDGCRDEFKKNPTKYLPMLDLAAKTKPGEKKDS